MSWIGRVVVATTVRRLVVIAIAAAFGLLAQCAQAAVCGSPTSTCTVAEAYQECKATADQEVAATPPSPGVQWTGYCTANASPPAPTAGNWTCRKKNSSGGTFGCTRVGETVVFYYTRGCEFAPPITNKGSRNSIALCVNGCLYQPQIESSPDGSTKHLNFGNGAFVGSAKWTPTGQACSVPNPENWDPSKTTCISTGGTYQECVKPNGDHCITTSRGDRHCWSNGQQGPRSSQDGKQGTDRKPAPQQPTPPPNVKDPTPGGNGNTCINSSCWNWGGWSGSGSTGGQGDSGTGGNDASEGGTGQTGGGDGGGGGEGENNDPGPVGGGVGTLYEKPTDTPTGLYDAFKADVSGAPIVQALQQFFVVPSMSGACPRWTWDVDFLDVSFDFDLCDPALETTLTLAGYLIMALAAYCGIRICLD